MTAPSGKQRWYLTTAGLGVGALALTGAALPGASSPSPSHPSKSAAPSASHAPAGAHLTAKSSSTSVGTDTVFTVSGKVADAKPGAKLRLQHATAAKDPKTGKTTDDWNSLAYTTFSAKDGSYSFLVKLDTAGTDKLRVYHPGDNEAAQGASPDFTVTVK